MKALGFVLGASAGLALMLSTSTFANVLTLSGPTFSGVVTWNNDGTVGFGGVNYTEVLQQDKLYSNFSAGSTLPAGAAASFSFAKVGVDERHTISFLYPFGSVGGTFSFGYEISVIPGSKFGLQRVAADLLQTDGTATLGKTFLDDGAGKTYTINFTKTGASGYSGSTSVVLTPAAKSLFVTDVLAIGAGGSDAGGLSNSFVQAPVVPEPATWAMVALGFAGLGLVASRNRRSAIAIF